jgi:hypothetical protein
MNHSKNINSTIVDGYFSLLDNLAPSCKLDLISKLSASINSGVSSKNKSFKKSFGAFVSKQTAEEIIKEIRSARVSNRNTESF